MRWFTLLIIGCLNIQAAGAVINVPADWPTIQLAINNSVSGDEIIVAPGTYFESINFNGKVITVRSSDPNDAGSVPEQQSYEVGTLGAVGAALLSVLLAGLALHRLRRRPAS